MEVYGDCAQKGKIHHLPQYYIYKALIKGNSGVYRVGMVHSPPEVEVVHSSYYTVWLVFFLGRMMACTDDLRHRHYIRFRLEYNAFYIWTGHV